MHAFEIGQIFWLEECPPLDGLVAKRRPVILIDDSDDIERGADPLLVVATTTAECQDYDRVEIPSIEREPGTTTGLPQRCWALPRWVLFVHRSRLKVYAGRLPRVTLEQLVEAIEARLDDPETDGIIGLGPGSA